MRQQFSKYPKIWKHKTAANGARTGRLNVNKEIEDVHDGCLQWSCFSSADNGNMS